MFPLLAATAAVLSVGVVLAGAQTPQPDVAGYWLGTLQAGGANLRIAIHVDRGAGGELTGKMDSLDQGARGIPISSLSLDGRKFAFTVPSVSGKYSGTLSADGQQLDGTWSQGPASLPLVFKRAKPEATRRPQDPVAPFPYESVDVTIPNAGAKVSLAGTLTFPKGAKGVPAVVLVSGSGPQNRDEEIMGHKPFLVLADHLTRKGIAVLRYDDRGVGKSTGNFAQATTLDFATDAEAAVAFLKGRPEVNASRIGIVGHSEGAIVAPIVASRSSSAVAFLVLMAAPGVPGEQVMYEQAAALNRAQGNSQEAIAANRAMQTRIFNILRTETDVTVAADKIKAIAGPAQAKALTSPWFRMFLTLDPAEYLRKVRVPVLAINGELDLQVLAGQNLPAVAKALEAGGNRDYALVKLASLNHLLQTAKTGGANEYSQIAETISPRALDTISSWILTLISNK
jgi:pimeloyl-ACP methyl ester carboxylesterase